KNAGRTGITFPNGLRLDVALNGEVSAVWPGETFPFLRNLTPPVLEFSGTPDKLESETAEAVVVSKAIKKAAMKWNLTGIEKTGGSHVMLHFLSDNGTVLKWEFKTAELKIDGRLYVAFAERADIPTSPTLIESLLFNSRLALGQDTAGHIARRMSCYAPPRGYAEFDLSGSTDTDTSTWQFFGSGQPFTWIAAPSGIYSEFVESPFTVFANQKISKGGSTIEQTIRLLAGRRRPPFELPFVWHAFSRGPEHGPNDWMAMYQFQRWNLRKQSGLKSFSPIPSATFQNTCTPEEIEKSLKAAAELGFSRVHLPWCPSPIEGLDSERSADMFRKVRSSGLVPSPWTAGNYSHGDSEKIFQNKSWYLCDVSGKIYQYFGKHPAIDLNNDEFRTWYYRTLERAIASGMGSIYLDMYGQGAQDVNYGTPESKTGLQGMLPVLKFFSDRNIMVGVEGQNPLTLDNFWYRQKIYLPFNGREFAMVGMSPGTHLTGDDLSLDYFRMAMYDCFGIINVDGYANDFERVPGEIEQIKRIGKLNPAINRALKLVGLPFVRETPFGTIWVSKRGAALFFWHGVRQLKLELPPGWRIQGTSGNTLTDVAPDSIILIEASTQS
ncbi:MAG: hypothetical protein ACYC4Q_11545, partial [Victivallaceae bacterium]